MEIGFHTFPSGKQYVYVKTPGEPRVFLRNILFLQRSSAPAQFAIVREWGAPRNEGAWEPPKGQMEWKELAESGVKPGSIVTPKALAKYMREGVLREMTEEAKVFPDEIRNLRALPLAYEQEWKDSGAPGKNQFRYQFWTATITDKTMLEAQKRMTTLVTHPDLHHMLLPDVKEKDAIVWWSASSDEKLLRGAFSKKMTRMFVEWYKKHGVSNS